MNPRLKFMLLLCVSMLCSCASASYRLRVEMNGQSRDTLKAKVLTAQTIWAEAKDLRLAYDLPAGVRLDREGITVAGDSGYELVATVSVSIDDSYSILTFFGLWGYDYPGDERWRNRFCNWQIPLNWITLTLWSWYTPFYWPCRVSESNDAADIKEREQRLINTLRSAAAAAGGTLLVITSLGDRPSRVPDGSGPSMHSLKMVTARGYVFRKQKTTADQR